MKLCNIGHRTKVMHKWMQTCGSRNTQIFIWKRTRVILIHTFFQEMSHVPFCFHQNCDFLVLTYISWWFFTRNRRYWFGTDVLDGTIFNHFHRICTNIFFHSPGFKVVSTAVPIRRNSTGITSDHRIRIHTAGRWSMIRNLHSLRSINVQLRLYCLNGLLPWTWWMLLLVVVLPEGEIQIVRMVRVVIWVDLPVIHTLGRIMFIVLINLCIIFMVEFMSGVNLRVISVAVLILAMVLAVDLAVLTWVMWVPRLGLTHNLNVILVDVLVWIIAITIEFLKIVDLIPLMSGVLLIALPLKIGVVRLFARMVVVWRRYCVEFRRRINYWRHVIVLKHVSENENRTFETRPKVWRFDPHVADSKL